MDAKMSISTFKMKKYQAMNICFQLIKKNTDY